MVPRAWISPLFLLFALKLAKAEARV